MRIVYQIINIYLFIFLNHYIEILKNSDIILINMGL
jgi:hypothetical protein